MKIVLPIITAFILSVIATVTTSIIVSSELNQSASITIFTLTFFAVLIGIIIHTIILQPKTNTKNKPAANKPAKKAKSSPQSQQADDSAAPAGPREEGEVKWFNSAKGYGFIIRESGEEIFVHYRSIRGTGRRSLYDGQQVEFSVSEGEKGLQADDVETL